MQDFLKRRSLSSFCNQERKDLWCLQSVQHSNHEGEARYIGYLWQW